MMWNKWEKSFWKPLMYAIILAIMVSLVFMTGLGSCSCGVKETFNLTALREPTSGYNGSLMITMENGQRSTVNWKFPNYSNCQNNGNGPCDVAPGQFDITHSDNAPTTTLRYNPINFKYDQQSQLFQVDTSYPEAYIKAIGADGKEFVSSAYTWSSDKDRNSTYTFSDDIYRRIMSDPIFMQPPSIQPHAMSQAAVVTSIPNQDSPPTQDQVPIQAPIKKDTRNHTKQFNHNNCNHKHKRNKQNKHT